ncbi:MAG: hypothetical protein ACI4VF_01715 [Lachnospirales bacterium]
MRNILRNILIFLLFVLTAYQIGMLWFDNFSLKSPFQIFNTKEVSTTDTMDYILDRIIVNVGDNKIVGKSSDNYNSEYKKSFDQVIAQCINNGDKADIGEFNWSNIFTSRTVVYEYRCVLDNDNISYLFGNNVKSDKIGDITAFDNIIIQSDNSGSTITTVFYNSQNNKYSARKLSDSDISSILFNASSNFVNGSGSDYISSVSSGFDIFLGNVFIPAWQENGIEYSELFVKGMYEDESMAEKNAEDFFNNPVAKWSSDENNALTYSDEVTVVKYDKNTNVMEYSSYKANNVNDSSFSANYIAAVNTIGMDSFIKNEYYLDSYSSSSGRYTFKFNYKLGDKYIKPSKNIKNKTSMDSFIEVVTELGKPIKYRKYAFYFESSNKKLVADCDFVSAIDKVYKDKKINDINLCYIADTNNKASLEWIINIENEEYMVSAKRE